MQKLTHVPLAITILLVYTLLEVSFKNMSLHTSYFRLQISRINAFYLLQTLHLIFHDQ